MCRSLNGSIGLSDGALKMEDQKMHDQSPNVNSIRHPKWGVPSAPSPRRGRIWCSERFETENDMKETASALETEL